jgi:DNA repair photolyase
VVGRGLSSIFERICGDMWSVTPYSVSDPIMAADDARDATRRFVRTAPSNSLYLLGAFSDAYPNIEADTGLTRAVLTELVATTSRCTG